MIDVAEPACGLIRSLPGHMEAPPVLLQEQELDGLLDRFYVKPARGSGSEAVCLAQGLDGVIEAAQYIFVEVGARHQMWLNALHDVQMIHVHAERRCVTMLL
jgi:hypothetical protein